MKTTSTKRAFLLSVCSILLCLVMLVGTTFAWFTDTASTAVNTIQSGKLDVALEMLVNGEWVSAEGKTLEFIKAQGNDPILWEPGCEYKLPDLRIVNNGNLALKYKLTVNSVVGDSKLLEAIDFTVKIGDAAPVALAGWDGVLLPRSDAELVTDLDVGETKPITISGHMKEEAGNEYQNKTLTGLGITVVATQYTYEFDSFNNTYDETATYPVRADATVAEGTETVIKDKPIDHTVMLVAPNGSLDGTVKKLTLVVNESATPASITVDTMQNSLSLDVTLKDQDNKTVTASGDHLFTVELDIGKNRSNVQLYHGDALMTNDGATLTDVADHYVYDEATGYVTMKVTHFSPFTAVYTKGNWSDSTSDGYGTPIDEDKKVVTISSAEELALLAKEVNSGKSYTGYTVKLVADIDLQENQWTPIGKSGNTFQGIFDGDGHTISNLLINKSWMSDVGLFGVTANGEVKNFTLHNANVTGYLDVGAVAGTPYTSKYSNIKLTGDVTIDGFAYVGGMFGKNAYANLTDLTIDVNSGSYVYANSQNYRTYVGGLVGFMGEGNQVVKNVTSNIDVTGTTCDVGGITGIAHYGNTFINCHSSGNVTLTAAQDVGDELEIGGIAGVWLNTAGQTVTLTGCTFTGKLSSTNVKTGNVTEFPYSGLVGFKYNRTSDAGTLTIN